MRIINSKYCLWFLLALPSYEYLIYFISPGGYELPWLSNIGLTSITKLLESSGYYPALLKSSGLWGVQLLILTLCITPASLLVKRWSWGRRLGLWLVSHRKYFGLAGAGYGLIHTVLYASFTWDVELIWLEALDWAFGSGWIAILLLAIVATTSNQFFVSLLGKYWKQVQRLSYLAIILVIWHWALLDFFIEDVLWWAIPLAMVKLLHIWLRITHGKARNII